jgi:hypothetical protein
MNDMWKYEGRPSLSIDSAALLPDIEAEHIYGTGIE